jgi:hypothetical protein
MRWVFGKMLREHKRMFPFSVPRELLKPASWSEDVSEMARGQPFSQILVYFKS